MDAGRAGFPPTLLTERVEALVAQKHARWVSVQEAAARSQALTRDE